MLRIGPLQIKLPAIAAALSGFSDRPMRIVARRYGAEFAMAEVVLDELVLLNGKLRARIFKIGEDDHPIGGQLMGSRPEQFGEAAGELVNAGYDSIDINFGCPVKKVLGRCRGGFLLSDPRGALDIVRSVINAVDGRRPVTLKMRRGFDDSAESERNFFTILDGAFELGVAAITVHGRTVKQRYIGPSNWEFLKRVKRHVGSRTILGSGDLFTADAVLRMMTETGVDGVTVARGAIGNPFIFRECRELLAGRSIAPPSVAEQREAMQLHLGELLELYDPVRGGAIFRKFGISYADLHPCRTEVRTAFINTRKIADVQAVIDTWYDDRRVWPAVLPRESITDLIAAGSAG
ncbi:MAG TPA: tRNA-dihydrouridine synthase [Terriglobia bacterium]|nr:tRNA-dihydrouridine synthase [Terriglobia bacterium]